MPVNKRETRGGGRRAAAAAIITIAAVLLLGALLLALKLPKIRAERARESAYRQAAAYAEAGDCEAAIAAFAELGDYKDSAEQLALAQAALAERERIAEEERLEAERREAERREEERLEAERDAAYRAAEELLSAGDEQAACGAFFALGDYRDSAQRAEEIYKRATAPETRRDAQVGDTVFFGRCEQDGRKANGPEWIEWLVLERKEDRILVISRYALASRAYEPSALGATWATCDVRTFLNISFLNLAFDAGEQALIPTVKVEAVPNPSYDTDQGPDTEDRIFLLSIEEADRYFPSDEARMCLPTATAVAQGIFESITYTRDGKATIFWWLRQPGRYNKTAACIDDNGALHPSGYMNDEDMVGVRPALWIELG